MTQEAHPRALPGHFQIDSFSPRFENYENSDAEYVTLNFKVAKTDLLGVIVDFVCISLARLRCPDIKSNIDSDVAMRVCFGCD